MHIDKNDIGGGIKMTRCVREKRTTTPPEDFESAKVRVAMTTDLQGLKTLSRVRYSHPPAICNWGPHACNYGPPYCNSGSHACNWGSPSYNL
uniref:Uncharacterized protein n=1 Tax=Cannabis sativa TaxID=3483 RepID=A0A803P219_CANSA